MTVSTTNMTEALTTERSTEGLPDFFIIGAMKAGTTTLYEYLCRHENVFGCPNKEPGFFSRSEVYARGLDWYREQFAAALPNQQRFEASTCYTRWPHFGDVARRIAEVTPDARFIYLMRHPVERAYSHYGHLMRLEVTMTFEEALNAYPEIIDASLYLRQIERFLIYFRREQFLFLTLDELQSDPAATLRRTQTFLGLPVRDLETHGEVRANQAGAPTAKVRISEQLRRVRRWPGIAQLANALPSSWRKGVHQTLTRTLSRSLVGRRLADQHKAKFAPMLPQTRAMLQERFAGPTQDLGRFLNRSLAPWLD